MPLALSQHVLCNIQTPDAFRHEENVEDTTHLWITSESICFFFSTMCWLGQRQKHGIWHGHTHFAQPNVVAISRYVRFLNNDDSGSTLYAEDVSLKHLLASWNLSMTLNSLRMPWTPLEHVSERTNMNTCMREPRCFSHGKTCDEGYHLKIPDIRNQHKLRINLTFTEECYIRNSADLSRVMK